MNNNIFFLLSVPSAVMVGATFGSVLVLAALLFFILFLAKRHRRKRNVIKPTGIEMKEQP